MKIVKLVAPLLSLLTVLIYSAGCTLVDSDRSPNIKIALDWYANSNHAGIYSAAANGHFAEEGLNVEIFTPADPSSIITLVASGRADFGITYQPDLVQARSQAVPAVAVMAFVQHPLNSVMALASSDINTIADLKDKQIGFPGIPSQAAILEAALESSGLSAAEAEAVVKNNLQNVGFDLVRVLLSGQVDAILGAYWTHESILIEQQDAPPKILKLEQNGAPDYYELLLITNEAMLVDNKPLVAKFVRAVRRGYMDVIANPDDALQALVDGGGADIVNSELERRGLELLVPLWSDPTVPFGWQDAKRWDDFVEWMQSRDLASNDFEAAAAFTNEFVQNQQ